MKRPNTTPGPWAAKNVNGTYVVRCPSGRTISENPGVTYEDDANAQFIAAAAPDMAKALEQVFAFTMANPENRELQPLHLATVSALVKAGYEF